MAKSRQSQQIRIIGGQWRGRKLPVLDGEGLRPSADRMRETLFNWIQFDIAGRHCVDLFAGAGGLGFEAASRGAASVVMVEKNHDAAQQLLDNQQRLQADACRVVRGDALAYATQLISAEVDVLFLDPPFRQGFLERLFPLLSGLLRSGALVYVEAEAEWPAVFPPDWGMIKEKRMGQSAARLFEVKASA